MTTQATRLAERIGSGKPVLLAEIVPPQGADPAEVRQLAKRFVGKVQALGVSDNRERVAMAALAAASLVAAEGLEPILHVTTRDRNRVALVSEVLGAQALGIGNVLCTSGTHQTLGRFRAAKNVYDIDTVQLLHAVTRLASDCRFVGEESGVQGAGPFCLGAVASPFAEPADLQLMRLVKKVEAGAKFLITQPIYDLDRFGAWWKEVTRRGIHEKVAIIAGIQPLVDGQLSDVQADKRPSAVVPQPVLAKVLGSTNPAEQRAKAVEISLETIKRLTGVAGLRGFCISGEGDPDAALTIIEKSGLGSN